MVYLREPPSIFVKYTTTVTPNKANIVESRKVESKCCLYSELMFLCQNSIKSVYNIPG